MEGEKDGRERNKGEANRDGTMGRSHDYRLNSLN